MRALTRLRGAGAIAALAVLGACSAGEARQTDVLRVYVASSIAEAVEEVSAAFALRPEAIGTRVIQYSAGSQTLRFQIENGAPADVFVSADLEHMESLERAGLVRNVRTVAYNGLALIVPASNPAGIESLYDLPRAERIVIGTEEVPIGRYTRQLLERAAEVRPPTEAGETRFDVEVMERVVSRETNVRLVRAKVELGEADAAFVYRTDALGRDASRVIPLPAGVDVLAEYRVGSVVRGGEGDTDAGGAVARAGQWIDFLLSQHGREILSEHGFAVPE